ncbi:MAG: transporter substrate-binding domain-containing protein [Clostridia bacterium]|nr:transporter substrate-binding domain-containing protein [Clostridia bacterium]
MKKRFLALLSVLLLLLAFSACAEETAAAPAWQAYNGMRLGVLTGPLMEDIAHECFPDSEYLLFNSYPDCIAALLAGKIDAYLGDEPSMKTVHAEQPKIDYIPERITENNYSFAFRKNDPESAALCGELNAFLAKCWADGTMQELDDIWFGMDEERKIVDMSGLTGENGTIRVVTTSTDMPFSYIKDGKNVGYDIDLVVRFCRYAGYKLELGDVDFSARIPAIQSGKYDFTTDMNVTPEREEQVLFSEPTSKGGVVLAVLTNESPALAQQSTAVSSFAQFSGKRIGVGVGTTSGQQVEARIPDAILSYYNNQADLLAALRANKIDAWATDETIPKFIMMENDDLMIVDGYLDTFEYAPIFAKTEKGQALRDQYSAFVDSLWENGVIQELDEIWYGKNEAKRTVLDYEALPDTNGTLRMAVDTSIIPFAYVKYNRVVGYDVDIASRFCREYGYRLVVEPMDFGGILSAVQSGKVDFAACGITVTEERKESVLFGSANYKTGAVLAVLKADDEQTANAAGQAETITLNQLNGKRIGVQTGTTFDEIVLETLPDAKISYFNSYPDMAAALETNKIDAFPGDEPVIRLMAAENNKLTVLEERMDDFDFGIALPKTEAGEKLLAEINVWFASMKESGELAKLTQKWTDGPESEKTVPDYASFPAPNGVLTLATEGAYAPMNYYRGDEVVGLEIDLIARFCEANGYGLKVVPMLFDGILPAIQSGKADLAAAGLTITEERKESVNFSDPYYTGGTVMAILKSKAAASTRQTDNTGIASLNDLAAARIGVQTGTICGALAETRLPDAKVYYFNTVTDVLAALSAGKLDAGCMDEPTLRFLKIENPQLVILEEYLDESNLAAVFPKTEAGQTLRDQYSEFLEKLWAEGTMREIDAVWFGEDDEKRTVIDFASLPAPNGTLRMAADLSMIPFTYMKNNKIVGYDVDVAARFCQTYGYGLEIVPMDFGGILPSVQSGKCEFASSCITVTQERAESVLFSSPNYYGGIAVGVLSTQAAAQMDIPEGKYTSLSQLANAKIGVQTGQSFDELVKKALPNAEIVYVNSKADLINSLKTGKIEAYAVDMPVLKSQMRQESRLTAIPEYLDQFDFGFVFPKSEDGEALCAQFNEFLRGIKANGTLDELEEKWNGESPAKEMMDYQALPASNGTLILATEALYEPFTYIQDGKIVGYDIEIAAHFCQAYGYGLKIENMDFSGILPGVYTGKYSFGAAGITITPERAESVLFSDPYFSGGTVLAVLKAEQQTSVVSEQKESFWDGIVSSFNKTFIREGRWKLFVDGVLTTLLITVLSVLFGTALGFAVFMMCRNGNIVANGVTRFSMWLVQGMPMVVLLMILYYIIFGTVAISGIFVAVIGFTLTFGASVYGLLKMGVGTIDRGQYEAAYALGYANRRTFFRIILPQAIPHILPAYKGEIVGLIKATAIVGYIAVQDLTKMGDIVRSRTYEAFFPLIAVTVIYFILEGLLGFLVSKIQISMNPKKRNPETILKGVKTHD